MNVNNLGKKEKKEKKLSPNEEFYSWLYDTPKVTESVFRDNRLSPTSGASFCPRRAYFHTVEDEKNEFEKERSPELEMYSDLGVTIEKWFARLFLRKGALLGHNIRLFESFPKKYELFLGGEIDLVIHNELTDKIEIVEVKSFGKSNPTDSSKPIYKWQLLTYMIFYHCNGRILGKPRNVLNDFDDNKYYHQKNNYMRYFEFNSPEIQVDLQKALLRIYQSRFSINKKIVPDIPDHVRKNDCYNSYCPFIEKCNHENKPKEVISDDILKDIEDAMLFFNDEEQVYIRRKQLYNEIQKYRKSNNLPRLDFNWFMSKF